MIRVTENHMEPVAKLMAECFKEDPLVKMQIRGIDNEKEFLENLLLCQLYVYEKTVDVYSADDKLRSVLIGYEKRKLFTWMKLLMLNIQSSSRMRRLVGKEDFKVYLRNLKEVSKIVDLKWQNQFIKKDYYRINIIAIAQEERGKGIFRALIMPIIDKCNKDNTPIILETNDPRHVEIYEHFGFNLVKTIPCKANELSQYCLIKYPNAPLG